MTSRVGPAAGMENCCSAVLEQERRAAIDAARSGDVDALRKNLRSFASADSDVGNQAFIVAVKNAQLEAVMLLLSSFPYEEDELIGAIETASADGYVRIIEVLCNHYLEKFCASSPVQSSPLGKRGSMVYGMFDIALRKAAENGHLLAVEELFKLSTDVKNKTLISSSGISDAHRAAVEAGHQQVGSQLASFLEKTH